MILKAVTLSLCILVMTAFPGTAWSNGGDSADPNNPNYGTDDWIAETAVHFLPANDSRWIKENIVAYLTGTEAPDNSAAAWNYTWELVYGDNSRHHNYYNLNHTAALDDSASKRAQEEYAKSLRALKNKNYRLAAFYAGAMSHYISDVAVWAHVRGKGSPHGPEDSKKHIEYENEIEKTIIANYYSNPDHTSLVFQNYMKFDGVYENLNGYEAAYLVGLNTDDGDGNLDTMQMEEMLPMGPKGDGTDVVIVNWYPDYKDRAGESLNLAANAIADALYTLNKEAGTGNIEPTPNRSPVARTPSMPVDSKLGFGALLVLILILLVFLQVFKGNGKKKGKKKGRGKRKR